MTQSYVCGIGLFSYLTYVQFLKILTVRYIVDFVNKTSSDKVCKRKAETVHSDIVGYYSGSKLPYCGIFKHVYRFDLLLNGKQHLFQISLISLK